MNRIFSRAALCVAASLCSVPALAQDELEETIITATRTPVPLDSVGAPVIVITRSDIERSLASDVSQLLQVHAGLEIARNGGPGQNTSLFTRGTDSNHTVVLVDGVRVNPGTIGGAALQNIAPEAIERIEIVKGPRSSLYGSDAIGGVVQIFTVSGAPGLGDRQASAGVSFGSDATQQVFADTAFATGRLRFGVGGSYLQSEGMPVFVDDASDRGWRNATERLFAEFAASEALTLRARGWRSSGRTEYSSQTFGTPAFADVSQDFENSVYSFGGDYRADSGLGVQANVSRSLDDIRQLQPGFGPSDFDYARTRRVTADLQLDLPRLGAHALSIGVQRSDENARAQSFGTVIDEDTRVTQAFVQDQFTAGIFESRLAVGFVDHQTFGGEVSWNAEVGASFASGTRITLSAGKAFRAPDSTDRFGFGGNPDLKPEISQQLELSIRQKLGARSLVTLAAFDNRIRDLINFVIVDPNTFDIQNRNVDRARVRGMELGYRFAGEAWRLRAELTLQDPRDRGLDQRLLRRSRESLMFAVDRDVGAFDLGVDLAAFGNRKDFGFPANVTLDPYTLVGATLRYRASGALTLQGRIDNLLDEDYTLASGYRTRGRAYSMGVRYRFD